MLHTENVARGGKLSFQNVGGKKSRGEKAPLKYVHAGRDCMQKMWLGGGKLDFQNVGGQKV